MSDLETLERFLRTGPCDVGSEEAIAILHGYPGLVAAGRDAAGRDPGVAAHLAACGPYGEGVNGLLLAITRG
jgi:hypothetical protein